MSTMAARSRARAGNLTAAAEEYRALLEEHGRLDQILSDFRDD